MKRLFLLFLGILIVYSVNPRVYSQSVSASIEKIRSNLKYYIIKGRITASHLNQKGQIPQRDTVTINADIMVKPRGKWPVLPDTMWVTKGFVKNGKVLTGEELSGTGCVTLNLFSWTIRMNAWQSEKTKRINSATKEFVVGIPRKYRNNLVRIRVDLDHEWGGPYANWPAFSYHHSVIYTGVLKDIVGYSSNPNKPKTKRDKLKEWLAKIPILSTKNRLGRYTFSKPRYVNIGNEYSKRAKEAINSFAKRNRIAKAEIIKGDGRKKRKIETDNPTLLDRLKYHAGKFAGNLAGDLPGGFLVSNRVESGVIKKLGLGDVKKTQIELNVDSNAASFYNKFNVISDRENRYATANSLVQKISNYANTIYNWTLGLFGKNTKRRLAIGYKLEYMEVVKKIKSGYAIDTLKKEIEDAGVIITEYQQIKSKQFVNSDPSKIANTYSKGRFKDPVNRFKFYIKYAKEKGDI